MKTRLCQILGIPNSETHPKAYENTVAAWREVGAFVAYCGALFVGAPLALVAMHAITAAVFAL